MRPKAQRSRACAECRSRRVKCDETPETCQQCRRLGLKCSGPIQGSVIIDMTQKVTKPRPRKKRAQVLDLEVRPSERQDFASSSQLALAQRNHPPITGRPQPIGDDALAASGWRHKLPGIHEPSQAGAYDQAFISHFVELNQGERAARHPISPFIHEMPGLRTGATGLPLRLSVRAATMAFYAKIHKSTPVMVDSSRWYIKSLVSQRASLAKLGGDSMPGDEDVMVPIILCLYEVYADTSASTIFQHLTAASRILEMRGPQNCSAGVGLVLFRVVRVADAHKSVVFNEPSVLSSPEWITLPFLGQAKSSHHALADVILAIPACIGLCGIKGNLGAFFSTEIPAICDLDPVQDCALRLFRQLDEWAAKFPDFCIVPTEPIGEERKETDSSNSTPQSPPPLVLSDTFVAVTAAGYHATRLILALLLCKVIARRRKAVQSPARAVLPSGMSLTKLLALAIEQSRSILQISSNLESTHPVGLSLIRSVFPVLIVAILGPQAREQKAAKEMLERWGQKRGLSGVAGTWVRT